MNQLNPTQLPTSIQFDDAGLVPVVLQDSASKAVLMIGFMNRDALEQTLATGKVHFWSRSRQKLWLKGEQSGNFQLVEEVRVNCEENSLLLLVHPQGPVCHEGYDTCYYRRVEPDGATLIVEEQRFDPQSVYGSK